MKTIYYLDDWTLDESISNAYRECEVSIILKYPEAYQFIELKPKERVKQIDNIFKANLKKLVALDLFSGFEVVGEKRRPAKIKTKVKFDLLARLNEIDFVDSIWIESIDHAKKIRLEEEIKDKYYCIKMTVVIDFEGVISKKQEIETRFVLIKAKTSDDAYEKLDKKRDEYTQRYLNSDGRFVRWKIDSFDDCYETDISCPEDLDREEGVEIYSKLKTRKIKSEHVWNGK